MRQFWMFVCMVASLAVNAEAEQRWKYSEATDDINNTKVRTVGVVADDGKSVLLLRVEDGKRPLLMLMPNQVMFPDKNDPSAKSMGIEISMRSTAMEKPISGMWRMPWMDYKQAQVPCDVAAAKNKVFGGDSVTLQLDKAGKRFKFPTKGEGCEGLQDAVEKAVEIAAPDKQKGDQ